MKGEKKFRIRVLSSYIYDDDDSLPHSEMGKKNKWFNGFVKHLVAKGISLQDIDIDFVSLSTDRAQDKTVRNEFRLQGVDLVICPGTDAVVRWCAIEDSIPTIYFGAHPENNGLELLEAKNVCGVRLHLPLIWNKENFSVIKKLLPEVNKIYFPLNLESEFAFDNVRQLYGYFRSRHNTPWIPHGSTYTGHRSVMFLAESIECEYYESPYIGLNEFSACLNEIPEDGKSVVVGFNDTALLPGAVSKLLDVVEKKSLPLFWVNNFPIICAGGVVDFSSDFYRVGIKVGELATQILVDKKPIDEIGIWEDQGQVSGINLARCSDLGIKVDDSLKSLFDKVHK